MLADLKGRFKDMRLFKKITLIQLILTIVAMIVLFTIQYSYLMPIIHDYEKLLEKRSFDDLSDYMGEMYNDVIGVVENIYGNKRMLAQLAGMKAGSGRAWDYETAQMLDSFCSNAFRSGTGILDIIFLSENGQVFHRSSRHYRTLRSSYDFATDSIVEKVRREKQKQGFYLGNSAQYILNENQKTISFAGVISDFEHLQSGDVIGTFVFNISFSSIEKSIEKSKEYLKGSLSVANFEDQIIFSTNENFVGRQFAGISRVYDTESSGVKLENETIVQTKLFRRPEVRVINSLQSHHLQRKMNTLTASMIVVLCIIIVVFSLLVSMISKLFNERLALIVGQMREVEKGNFAVRIPVTAHDEIGELSGIFNEMCAQLERHVKRVYEAEIEQKNFEMKALQSQINPHFLFNTLESIRMKAVVDKQHELAQMISALGNLFRRSIKTTSTLITIQDEMEYIASYLDLMQFRHADTLSYSIRNEEGILSCGIPKLTLQPIVENAIMHGLQNTGEGTVAITGRREQGRIVIEVEDNGVGLEADALSGLLAEIYAEQEPEKPQNHYKIGLRNVHRRLVMLFGEEYGVSIQSGAGKGTCVSVSLPVVQKEDFF